MKDLLAIDIYPERHCEECSEIVHNHFDCPACGKERAETDSYSDLADDTGDCTIKCCACGAEFHTLGSDPYDYRVKQWERIK